MPVDEMFDILPQDAAWGHAMAHEIGHLLKGSNSHSPQGLMSKHWYANELQAAAMGSLNFTAEDASLMRPRLAQAEGRK